MYAEVIIDADIPSLPRTFSYRIPEEMESSVFEGACVAVPFSGREMVGYVLSTSETTPKYNDIKPISAVIIEACSLNSPLLHLASWMSERYITTLSTAVRAIVPEIMSATVNSIVRLLNPQSVHPSSMKQKKLVDALSELGGEADADVLKAKSGIESFASTLRQLRNREVVQVLRTLELPKVKPLMVKGVQIVEAEEIPDLESLLARAPRQAAMMKELTRSDGPVRQSDLVQRSGSSTANPIKALIQKGLAERVDIRIRRDPFKIRSSAPKQGITLNKSQEDALGIIKDGLSAESPQNTLLYGVTGSGKTEVYLRSIDEILESGRSCISLVPEISLTAHLMDIYKSRFGDRVAILHSRLSAGERHDEWRRIESGEAGVVLGARSAIFAPMNNLGLVVVDEEHEPSYKQDNSPRYNAKAAAEKRADIEEASVILGSATPSIESFYRASSGEIKLAVLDRRIDERPLPSVTVVDLRGEFSHGKRGVFSDELRDAVAERLSRREQTVLFVNRRGYASFILCRTCGYTARCTNCAVSLTYHAAERQLRCHHCDAKHNAPDICPNCGGPHIRQFGIGTERVEEEARKLFPDAGIIRMDSDTTRRKNAHLKLLDAFREKKADILIGTQMVAKGLDFPNVTLVGVVSADTSLHLPDFRAAERTFQLLTQVSGRGGRGDLPGKAIIQSFSPEHYAIRAAARHDYLSFYGQEIGYRKELSYPPFSRLVNIVSSDPVEDYAEEKLFEIRKLLGTKLTDSIEVMGPAPAPLSKLKGLYRWHMVLKCLVSADMVDLQSALHEVFEGLPSSIRMGSAIDVDPMMML